MTQFPSLNYHQTRLPFTDTVEKALATAQQINKQGEIDGLRPIIFTTFVDPNIMRTFNEAVEGHIIDLFRKFVGPLETELGMKSAHSIVFATTKNITVVSPLSITPSCTTTGKRTVGSMKRM